MHFIRWVIALATAIFSIAISSSKNIPVSNNINHFELSECGDINNGPCDNSTAFELSSDDEESASPIAARLEAFGDITSEFITSFATEFSKSQSVPGIGGNWKNIGMTSPTAEKDFSPLIKSYIESGRIR